LEVYELPVYPKGMLVEPFCQTLAGTLQNCLQNALGDYSVEHRDLRQAANKGLRAVQHGGLELSGPD
jgi:hypothetical protein